MNQPDFIASYWKTNSAGELLVGGLAVSSLATRHGTPVFIYDRNVVEEKYKKLRVALPKNFSISYSVKANPHPIFLKFFLEKKCGLEIASAGELFQARSAGCLARNILFAGPGKTEAELALGIAEGVGEIHAESELEVDRISKISEKLGKTAEIALRVNPTEEGQGGAMQMGGKSAPFGVDEERLEPLLHRIENDSRLHFLGIHVFSGTQILDHQVLLDQYRKAFEIGRQVAHLLRRPLHTLDFGGGLGIPYLQGETELDLHRLNQGLSQMMAEIDSEDCFQQTRFVVEPGRFLVGESGVYVTRINDIKRSRGKKYLIVDGGMNHHLAASGNLGQVMRRNFPVAILDRLDAPATDTVDVVGPLCTPLDTLARSAKLPMAEVGDLVGIFQSGAYARSASPLGFLSHPTPPEVWVEDDQDFLIRRRGRIEDYLLDVQSTDQVIETLG
jgi:diaminopimelate decarboxylase